MTRLPSLRQLEYLVALAETRHFRRAAERCNTTQPTLSEQIKSLEKRLGVQLIERHRSGVLLTTIGAQITEVARRILRDAGEIRSIAAGADQTLRGVLRLGVPSTIGPYLLPHIVPDIHRAYPELKLYVREDLPQILARALEAGDYDLIITPLPVRGEELYTVELFREPLFLTVGTDHPLAQRDRVQKSDLEGEVVLTLGPGHQLHDVVHSLCEELGALMRRDYEGTSLDMLREMAITGLGVTFMPGLYARRELVNDTNLKLLQLHGRFIYRTIGMAWRKSTARHPTLEKLASFCRDLIHAQFGDLSKAA